MSNRDRTAEMLPTCSRGAWPVTTPIDTPASSGTMPTRAASPGSSPTARRRPAGRGSPPGRHPWSAAVIARPSCGTPAGSRPRMPPRTARRPPAQRPRTSRRRRRPRSCPAPPSPRLVRHHVAHHERALAGRQAPVDQEQVVAGHVLRAGCGARCRPGATCWWWGRPCRGLSGRHRVDLVRRDAPPGWRRRRAPGPATPAAEDRSGPWSGGRPGRGPGGRWAARSGRSWRCPGPGWATARPPGAGRRPRSPASAGCGRAAVGKGQHRPGRLALGDPGRGDRAGGHQLGAQQHPPQARHQGQQAGDAHRSSSG